MSIFPGSKERDILVNFIPFILPFRRRALDLSRSENGIIKSLFSLSQCCANGKSLDQPRPLTQISSFGIYQSLEQSITVK